LLEATSLAVEPISDRGRVRPFLKWAGGKRQLIPQLRRFVPSHFEQYFEPFVGSGALFFDLAGSGDLDGHHVWLSDVNRDLIGTYCALGRDAESVIAALTEHDRLHHGSPQEHFYRVRDHLFNPQRDPLVGTNPAGIEDYPPALAAMFIYLNRTGFNGLYRLNSRGAFNVPAGRYASPKICDARNLRAVASLLGRSTVNIGYGSFESVLARAARGDLLYFDPPYAPVSDTANFTAYTAFGFSSDDQRRLQRAVVELAHRGCHVIVSNSAAPLIKELYASNQAARRAGLRAHKVRARRAINSNASRRGEVAEYIISNVG